MVKKAIITVLLVKESDEKANEEIEREILQGLSEDVSVIPWCEKIEKVRVKEV